MIQRLLRLYLFIGLASSAYATDYYWVGGTGNWSDYLNHWATTSGGSVFQPQVPTSNDNVYFDVNSFSAAGQIVTLDETIEYCNDMDWTNANFNPKMDKPNTLNIFGSLLFNSTMTLSGSGDVYFKSSQAGQTITSSGVVFNSDIRFDGIGGGWTLQDSLEISNNLYLVNGTLNTGDNNIRCGDFSGYVGSTTNLGSSDVTLTGIGIVWSMGGTINAGTSTIKMVGNSGTYHRFDSNSKVYYNLYCTGLAESQMAYGGTFNKVTFNNNATIWTSCTMDTLEVTPGITLRLDDGVTQTINSYLNLNGNCQAGITIGSVTAGSSTGFSMSGGTMLVNYVNLQDVAASGSSTFIANNSIDISGNSGWTINAPASKNYYWVGDGGDWSDGSHWSLSSGGTAQNCIPNPSDNVYFDANSFGTSGQSVILDLDADCNSMDWTGVTNNPTIAKSNDLRIYGSLTLDENMSISGSDDIYFKSSQTGQTITSSGVVFNSDIRFDGIGGGWTLQDSLEISNNLYLVNGTLNTGDNNIRCGDFSGYVGSTTNLGSSDVTLTGIGIVWSMGGTINAGTSTIKMVGNSGTYHRFDSNSKVYYNLYCTGLAESQMAYGGTFNKVTFNNNATIWTSCTMDTLEVTPGITLQLDDGVTQTINDQLLISGEPGFPVELRSTTSGVQSTISKLSDTLCLEYLYLTDINATGGATFYAGLGCDDVSNNSGWIFDVNTPCTNLDSCSVVNTLLNDTICSGDSILIGSLYQASPGVYVDSLFDSEGCDSIVTTNLTVNPVYVGTDSITICQNDSFFAAGNYQTEAGLYKDTISSINGCDSIIILTFLIVNSITDSTIYKNICIGDSLLAGGNYQSTSGIYIDTLTNTKGCDSLFITNLTVNSIYVDSNNVTICQNDSFFVSGEYQTSPGLYSDTLISLIGCDSITLTYLSIQQVQNTAMNLSICEGDSLFAGGAYQTTGGLYIDSLVSIYGCDSVVITSLTILDQLSEISVITGIVYYNGLPVTAGIVKLIVKPFNNPNSMMDVDSTYINPDGSFTFTNLYPGKYLLKALADTTLYPNAVATYHDSTNHWQWASFIELGCNETVNADISLIYFPTTIGHSNIDGEIVSGGPGKKPIPAEFFYGIGVSLEEIPDNSVIEYSVSDQNGKFKFTKIPDGDYRLYVDILGYEMDTTHLITVDSSIKKIVVTICVDSSGITVCNIETSVPAINDHYTDISIYPNPNSGVFALEIEYQAITELQLQLTNITGQVVYSDHVFTSFYKKEIDLRNYAKGIYTLKIVSDYGVVCGKMIYR